MVEQVFEVLYELKKYNNKLIPAIENAVEDLRSQREDKALNLVVQIIDGLKWVIEVVFYTRTVFDERGFIFEDYKINDTLKEILNSLENQDYVLLGDLFEYEILPTLSKIQNALEDI